MRSQMRRSLPGYRLTCMLWHGQMMLAPRDLEFPLPAPMRSVTNPGSGTTAHGGAALEDMSACLEALLGNRVPRDS